MSDSPLDNIEAVRRVNIRPGDKIVLEHPGHLSQEAFGRVRQSAEQFFGCPVAILEEGMRVAIVGEADEILSDVEGDAMEAKGE